VPAQVTGDLAATHRVPGQGDIGEVESVEQRRQVVGERIEFVSRAGVIGTAMAPAVIGDSARVWPTR
jgi:hypothetical protein